MRIRILPFVAIGTVVLIVGAILTVTHLQPTNSNVQTQGLSGPVAQPTPIHHYGAESGAVSDTLISPDNVTLHIVEIQRGTTRWLFHIHAHNNAGLGVSILDAGTNHYFFLGLKGTPGVPITPSDITVTLTSPAAADVAAHPALPSAVAPGADVDGWLAADLTHTKYPPFQLFYVYGTVTAPACANPADQSTCHPSVGYRTLAWTL
jgi:hypothetical protein